MAFGFHFEKWLNDTLIELKRVTDERRLAIIPTNTTRCYVTKGKDSMAELRRKESEEKTRKDNTTTQMQTQLARQNNDRYKLVWDEDDDDPMDIVDNDVIHVDDNDSVCSGSRTRTERVARILGQTADELNSTDVIYNEDESFYELSNDVLSQGNVKLADNLNDDSFRYSFSLDFTDDDRSVVSEPKSGVDDCDDTDQDDIPTCQEILPDFVMENEFVQITREAGRLAVERTTDSERKVQCAEQTKNRQNGAVLTGLQNGFMRSVLGVGGKEKTPNGAPMAFSVRYVKTGEFIDDNPYIDDDLQPVDEKDGRGSRLSVSTPMPMLPMTMDGLESEDDILLDVYSLTKVMGKSRSQEPIIVDSHSHQSHQDTSWRSAAASWADRHHRLLLGVGLTFSSLFLIGAVSAVIFTVVEIIQ